MTEKQSDQLLELLASIAEPLRILCDMAERAQGNDDEF